ncbi:MAG: hypothetical protein HKN56_08175 [Gammaproteobacteria bacterium]|nr:hypothetical protein [Gammaproteobacteria bacterium]
MMRALLQRLLIVGLLCFSGAAFAEPWCLVRDAKENCRFYEPEPCYLEANRGGGYCKPNPRELGAKGAAPYCLVSEGGRVCKYRSRGRCLTDARRRNGGCVRNTELDLARRALGEQRVQGCIGNDCEQAFQDFSAPDALEAAGYEPPSTDAVDILE